MHLMSCLFFVAYYQLFLDARQAPAMRQRMLCQEIISDCLCSSPRELRAWPPPSRTVTYTACSTQSPIGPPRHGWPCFILFCTRSSCLHRQDIPVGNQKYCQSNHYVCGPVSEVVLCDFVSTLVDEGLKHRSIKIYLSGMRYYQIKSGYVTLILFRGRYATSGVRHERRLVSSSQGWRKSPGSPSYHTGITPSTKRGVVAVR